MLKENSKNKNVAGVVEVPRNDANNTCHLKKEESKMEDTYSLVVGIVAISSIVFTIVLTIVTIMIPFHIRGIRKGIDKIAELLKERREI